MADFYRDKFINLRKIKGFTIEKIIKQAGITRVTLWRWENGKNEPSEMQIRALAKILDVSVSEFSDLKDEKPHSKAHFSDIINSWIVLADTKEQQLISQENKLIELIQRRYNELLQTSTVIRALLNSMDSGFYIKDINLKYITANRTFLDNLSLNRNYSVFGKEDKDFFSTIESKKNSEEDQKVLITGRAVTDHEGFIPGTRKKRWGLISKQPIFDSENNIAGIVGTFVDITVRRKNENRRKLLESAIDKIEEYCIWVSRTETGDRFKSRYIYINNSVESIFGVEKERALKDASLLLHNVHRDSRKEVDIFLASKLPSDKVVYKYIHPKTKKLRWFYTVVYKFDEELYGITRDITEVKKALNERFLLNTLLSASEDIVAFYNLEDNKVLYINDVVERITGYSKEEFYDDITMWRKVVHNDDWDEFQKLYKCEEWIGIVKFRVICKNGEIKHLCSTTHSHKEIEKRNYHVWILRCITETDGCHLKSKCTADHYINKYEIASKMKHKGVDPELIYDITGVNVKDIMCRHKVYTV